MALESAGRGPHSRTIIVQHWKVDCRRQSEPRQGRSEERQRWGTYGIQGLNEENFPARIKAHSSISSGFSRERILLLYFSSYILSRGVCVSVCVIYVGTCSKVLHWRSEDNPWEFSPSVLELEHMVRLFRTLLYLLSHLIATVAHFSGFCVFFHIDSPEVP